VEVSIAAQPRFPDPILDPDTHSFSPARKQITNLEMLRSFLSSSVAADFLGFLLALNDAVKGRALGDVCPSSPAIQSLISVLDTLWEWVNDIPPAAHTLRYGNPAYREWYGRLKAEAKSLLSPVLDESLRNRTDILSELTPYFIDSFGNETRIDYGTGHETTFAALLFCLARLGIVGKDDGAALVSLVFARYLRLMRRIQTTYWLEPAGSHGVWGLDDYQFLPFVWGAAQLVDHPFLKPASIHNSEALDTYAEDYLYFSCIKFVRQVKKGPLAETSPMLNDISGIASWSKINKGMIKMYQAEVLSKLPIMQHFLFGSLLPYPQNN